MQSFKIIVEKHTEGYVAYPIGLKGVVVGEGDTYEQAVADVTSAIEFHIETFGAEVLEIEEPVLDVFIAEAELLSDTPISSRRSQNQSHPNVRKIGLSRGS